MTQTRKQLQKTNSKNVITFGYGRSQSEKDMFGFEGGAEYFITNKNEVMKQSKIEKDTFVFIGLTNQFQNK